MKCRQLVCQTAIIAISWFSFGIQASLVGLCMTGRIYL